MARERNPERDKARQIWLDSGGTLTARQVAEQVGVKPEQVRKWKSLDSWAAELEAQKPPRKRGGQPGNKNAAGAGAPHGNRNAETHGAYSTVRLADLPDEQREYLNPRFQKPLSGTTTHRRAGAAHMTGYTALKNSCGPTTSHARRTPSGSDGPRDCRRPARKKCGAIRTAGF